MTGAHTEFDYRIACEIRRRWELPEWLSDDELIMDLRDSFYWGVVGVVLAWQDLVASIKIALRDLFSRG